jgi:hypothetical protein
LGSLNILLQNNESKTKVKKTPKEEGTSCEIGGSAVMMRIQVFWDVTLCRLMSISWCFEGLLQLSTQVADFLRNTEIQETKCLSISVSFVSPCMYNKDTLVAKDVKEHAQII